MSGALKHMERSHKTCNKNYEQFRKSTLRSSKVNQRLIRQAVRDTLFARLLGGSKRQAKGDK